MYYYNLFIFGDSVAWGKYDPAGGGWSSRLMKYLLRNNMKSISKQSGEYFTVYNLSVPGSTVAETFVRFRSETDSRQKRNTKNIFIFALGINDNLDAEFVNQYVRLLFEAKSYSNNIYVLKYFDDRDLLKKICAQNVRLVDCTPSLEKGRKYDSKHPNEHGHKIIYQIIKNVLLQHFLKNKLP